MNCFCVSTNKKIQHQGKMELSLILIVLYVCGTSAISIMPELKHNILIFEYGVNFRYEGMLSHSFDRFYGVTKIEIPKVLNLNLTLFQFDYNCSHVVNIEKGMNFKILSTIKEMFYILEMHIDLGQMYLPLQSTIDMWNTTIPLKFHILAHAYIPRAHVPPPPINQRSLEHH